MASTTMAPTRAERLKRSKRAADRARVYNAHKGSRDSKLQHNEHQSADDLYSPPVEDGRSRTELDQALRQEKEADALLLENEKKHTGAKILEDSAPNDSPEAKPAVTATTDTEVPVTVPPTPLPPPPPPPPSVRYTWDEDPISNMEEMHIMKQLTQGATGNVPLTTAAKPQPGSPGSRLSKRSVNSRRSNRSTRTLEEVVSITILQTAAEGTDAAHFLVREEHRGAPFDEPPATTPDILADLLSLSVDGEVENHPAPHRPLSPTEKPSSPAPAEDMYSLYSMPVDDPYAGWLPAKEGDVVPAPTNSEDIEDQNDLERAVMRTKALMDDLSDMSSSILRGQSVYSNEPRHQELVEEEGSAGSDESASSHSSGGSRSLELAYSSSARDDHSTDDERVSLSEQARNAMPFLYQPAGSSPSGRSQKSMEEDGFPEPSASDVFDGIDENEESDDTSESSEEEARSAADRSGAFPSMLATMQEAPGMESSEAETEEEEDEWDREEQLREVEEAEKKENPFEASQFEEDDDDWTTFDDSPFADAATDTSYHVVEESEHVDDDSQGAKVTDVSSRTYGSGETAPLPSSEDSFPDSPTSIAEFSKSRLTQPEVKAIGMEEWDSSTMAEI